MKIWLDSNGLMYPFGENGILFRAEFDELIYKEVKDLDVESAEKAIKSQFYGDHFKFEPNTKEPWSHDNHKAIIAISKRNNLNYHKRMYWKDFHKMLHPKDLILFAWATGNWYSWIALLGLWFTSFNMILSCLTDTKIRPGIIERIKNRWFFGKLQRIERNGTVVLKTYKSPFNETEYTIKYMLETDGKLLAWLILSTFNLPITKRLCNWAIKHNKEFGSWKKCFDIYFEDEDHPNRNFKESTYLL